MALLGLYASILGFPLCGFQSSMLDSHCGVRSGLGFRVSLGAGVCLLWFKYALGEASLERSSLVLSPPYRRTSKVDSCCE